MYGEEGPKRASRLGDESVELGKGKAVLLLSLKFCGRRPRRGERNHRLGEKEGVSTPVASP